MKLSTSPSILFVIGVNGAGKTTTIGKMAATVPMDVPTTTMVSGCMAARKMMNGIGRTMLTMMSRMR